jgi:hypothetical protein
MQSSEPKDRQETLKRGYRLYKRVCQSQTRRLGPRYFFFLFSFLLENPRWGKEKLPISKEGKKARAQKNKLFFFFFPLSMPFKISSNVLPPLGSLTP